MDTLIVFGAKYLFLLVALGAAFPVLALRAERRWEYVTNAAVAALLAFVLTKIAGRLYFDPRPFTHGVRALMPHVPDNGFPSDHAVLSFTAALLSLRYSRALAGVLLALAALVALCRVLSGVHTPLDVVAGASLGACSYLFASLLQKSVLSLFAKKTSR